MAQAPRSPGLDPLLPLIAEIVNELLAEGECVRPLDVLVRLEILEAAQIDEWRAGRLPYLERGIRAGLARVARLLDLLQHHALSLGLEPQLGKYQRRANGRKVPLRFSKRGDRASEEAYARHFVRRGAPSTE